MNSISRLLRWGCGILAVVALGLGIYMGMVKNLEGESYFVFTVAVTWWAVGAFASLVLLGLSEILEVLVAIKKGILSNSPK